MAAVPLFWDTNMATVTSRENTLYRSFSIFRHHVENAYVYPAHACTVETAGFVLFILFD